MKAKSDKASDKSKRNVKQSQRKCVTEPIKAESKRNSHNGHCPANILREYNLWRRGEGKYKWNDNPKKNAEFPYTAKEIGTAIDCAIAVLKEYNSKARMTCDCKDCSFRGMDLCEHRKYLDVIRELRKEIIINNHILAGIAGPLYDHDLHSEENDVTDLISKNLAVLDQTKLEE